MASCKETLTGLGVEESPRRFVQKSRLPHPLKKIRVVQSKRLLESPIALQADSSCKKGKERHRNGDPNPS